jgi:hypothetical protein
MGVLLMTCPATGKEFSTGLQLEKAAIRQLPLNQVGKAFCPYCKTEHTWRVREARWVDAIPPELWIENQ